MTLKTMNLRTHAALSLLFGLGLIWVSGVSAQSLPDGPGKAQLQTVCTACHGTGQGYGERSPDPWPMAGGCRANEGLWRHWVQ